MPPFSRHRRTIVSRRRFASDLAHNGLGLSIWGLLNARAALAETTAAATPPTSRLSPIRSCILIFYYGGPSHLDTFDMKPAAPAEIRGEFKPVSTVVPGLPICEHLPHMARVMDRVALIRSMHHANRLHDSASTEVLTGRPSLGGDVENFAPVPQFFPSFGAVVNSLRQNKRVDIAHAALPWVFHNVVDVPCQGGGFLGKAFDPFQISGDPQSSTYSIAALNRPADLTPLRSSTRRQLLGLLESTWPDSATVPAMRARKVFYQKAYELLDSPVVRGALDIQQEDQPTRRRYGLQTKWQRGSGNGAGQAYGRNLRGQNLLLARRLVEAGVPFVNVYDYKQQGQNWDSHSDNFGQHKRFLLPAADQSLSALIEDLETRGLLDSTLVVAMGEFGRTPKINASAGRDHWPDCYTLLLAGGGIQGGALHGASDPLGAYPIEAPVTPADLAATIFWRFGLNPKNEIHDMTGRPYRLADGRPVKDIFANT